MNKTRESFNKVGLIVCGAFLACATYGQPGPSVEVVARAPAVEVGLPSVSIHVVSDFYEPLAPHGEWVEVASYGRCWRPAQVEVGWRPYCNGSWQQTDAGWYWVSDEPWAWATYHYGRWDFNPQYGWYWMPQVQWAPAWVSWHEGGGYIGWAPLQPSARISAGGSVEVNVALIPPGGFIFVEQRHFLEPIRPATVMVDNVLIRNKTTSISGARVVNNAVINQGPAPAVIEKASGQKIQSVPVHELRQKSEAPVIARQKLPASTGERLAQPAVHSETKLPPGKTVVPAAPPQIGKEPDKTVRRPVVEKPVVTEKKGPDTAEKDHEKKPGE
jgi:hypothetical protein